MDSSGDDARKKRDSTQVEDHNKEEEEKSKKVRVHHLSERKASPARRLVVASSPRSLEAGTETTPKSFDTSSSPSSENRSNSTKVWDLETALLWLVQVGPNIKEYITNDHWVTFRVGHAGDASTIAQWYRQSQSSEESPELETKQQSLDVFAEGESPSSMLEVWLADGMGDEDTPPSVHGLLAQIHTREDDKSTSSLGGIILLTIAWSDGERIFRVEWMQVDPSLPQEVAAPLEQRMWLRLSTLATMMACEVLTINDHYVMAGTTQSTPKLPPSAE